MLDQMLDSHVEFHDSKHPLLTTDQFIDVGSIFYDEREEIVFSTEVKDKFMQIWRDCEDK
jgi:hypothetical protein